MSLEANLTLHYVEVEVNMPTKNFIPVQDHVYIHAFKCDNITNNRKIIISLCYNTNNMLMQLLHYKYDQTMKSLSSSSGCLTIRVIVAGGS